MEEDLYKIENTDYNFETLACYEYVYFEPVTLHVCADGESGSIMFKSSYDDYSYTIVSFFEYKHLDTHIYFENEFGEFSKALAYLEPVGVGLNY